MPLAGDPARLGVAFTFDATAPAAVSVFFGAAEEPGRRCALVCAAPPAKAVLYPKGLGHTFPPLGGGANDDDATSASLSADSARALAALPLPGPPPTQGGAAAARVPPHPHALVIRLEALTPAGAEAGLDLATLIPGAPHVDGVQSQTTFAALLPGGGGGGG